MNGRGKVAGRAGGRVAGKAGWLLGAWMLGGALTAAAEEPAAAVGAAAAAAASAPPAAAGAPPPAAAGAPTSAAAGAPTSAAAGEPTPAAAGEPTPVAVATPVDAMVEREARAVAAGREPAALEHGDFVQVPFGHQVPVLRCAPLRVCLIELEEGELVLNTVTGDAARWILDRAAAGPRAATTVIVAKPTACNLTTNLAITTNRRIYQVTLDSPPCKSEEGENPHQPFTRLLRFYYPDELVRSWASAAAARQAAAAEAARSLTPLAGAAARTPGAPAAAGTGESGETAEAAAGAGLPLASLHFNYRWTRTGKYPWTPAAVFDDGVHTYIRLPGSGLGQQAPVLFLLDRRGATALLNYAIRGQYYVTDRVFERAALVIGSGKDQQRLDITRER